MLVLGVETSCDDTAAAVLRDGRTILANTVSSQDEENSGTTISLYLPNIELNKDQTYLQ